MLRYQWFKPEQEKYAVLTEKRRIYTRKSWAFKQEMKDLYVHSRRTYYIASNQEMVKLIKTSILPFTMVELTVEPRIFWALIRKIMAYYGHIMASKLRGVIHLQ